MNCSTSGLPVYHQLPEFTQTHAHWVGDAIQPSHSLSSPFSSHLQSFPASGSFLMSQLFAWDGQSTGVSASASVLPMKIQDWSPLGWTGWILKNLLQHHSSKAAILLLSQQKRHRCTEVFWTLWERARVGWFGRMALKYYNIICETNCQFRFNAWYRMLRAGALGWPRGMVWGGRWEGGSGWGTCVHLWWIHVDVWQNQYNIVK